MPPKLPQGSTLTGKDGVTRRQTHAFIPVDFLELLKNHLRERGETATAFYERALRGEMARDLAVGDLSDPKVYARERERVVQEAKQIGEDVDAAIMGLFQRRQAALHAKEGAAEVAARRERVERSRVK